MKTLITPVALLLSAMPFTFFKMEKGARLQDSEPSRPKRIPFSRGREAFFGEVSGGYELDCCKINYLFLYNKKTGYSIGFADINTGSNSIVNYWRCLDFFNIRKANLIFPETGDLSFIFVKEKKNLEMPIDSIGGFVDKTLSIRDEIREENKNFLNERADPIKAYKDPLRGSLLLHKNYDEYKFGYYRLKEDFIKERFKKLSKEFRSDSGVFISNKENEVTISKEGGVPRDFQKSLVHYFETHNRDIAFSNAISTGEGISARLLNNLQFAPFNEELDLLNKSNILSVFGVFKGKSGNESIIWGMAEDKESKERFYWITDLESDISVLSQ